MGEPPGRTQPVRVDEREAGDGFDGTWVAHPGLVPVATEIFDSVLGDRSNQKERQRDDVVANAAFFYGVLWTLRSEESPIWSRMSFRAAEDNFHRCARWGTRATVHWPGLGEVGVCDLVLHRLLPMAHAGLESWGVAAEARERYLGVIEARARTGRNGAWWQAATVRALEAAGTDRPTALRRMLRHYCQAMHSNEPVHTWQVPASRVLGP